MSRIQDYTSRVDIAFAQPLIATLSVETEYSKADARISYDPALGKYWVQPLYKSAFTVEKLSDIDAITIARGLHEKIQFDFARCLETDGVEVSSDEEYFAIEIPNALTAEELRAFALHVLKEFDTRYVPSLEEVEREVVAGLREIIAADEGARGTVSAVAAMIEEMRVIEETAEREHARRMAAMDALIARTRGAA